MNAKYVPSRPAHSCSLPASTWRESPGEHNLSIRSRCANRSLFEGSGTSVHRSSSRPFGSFTDASSSTVPHLVVATVTISLLPLHEIISVHSGSVRRGVLLFHHHRHQTRSSHECCTAPVTPRPPHASTTAASHCSAQR